MTVRGKVRSSLPEKERRQMREEKKTVDDFTARKVGEIVGDGLEDVTAAFEEVLYRDWIPRMYAAILGAVRELPQEHREFVLGRQGKACWDFSKALVGGREGKSWEQFKKGVEKLPPPLGPYKFTELGNDMCLWTYQLSKNAEGRGMCWCPISRMNLLPGVRGAAGEENAFPELCCGCSPSYMVNAIEDCTDRKVCRFDTLCTVHTSSDPDIEEDRWVVHFRKAAHSKEYPEE